MRSRGGYRPDFIVAGVEDRGFNGPPTARGKYIQWHSDRGAVMSYPFTAAATRVGELIDAARGSSKQEIGQGTGGSVSRQNYNFDAGVNKNIVICCDGTWNSSDQTDEGEIAPTNVWKIYRAIDNDNPPDKRRLGHVPQITWYDAGVGSELGKLGKFATWLGNQLKLKKLGTFIEGATGMGLSENIREAYVWLCQVYEPGDRIYLFGFSRGAFQVRSLSGLIYHCGLLKADFVNYAPTAFKDYLSLRKTWKDTTDDTPLRQIKRPSRSDSNGTSIIHDPAQLRIHFLGVWDTVAGLGVPMWGWSFELFRIRTKNHDTSLVRIVDHAFHALAMDEQRSSFMPVLLEEPKGYKGQLEQRWFRGAHADVGGGYARCGLSDVALEWMMEKAESANLRLRPEAWSALRPDATSALHDETARNPNYVLAGLWPRMFPVTAQDFQAYGRVHDSVQARQAHLSRLTPDDWLFRMANAYRPDGDNRFRSGDLTNEGWNRPCLDPRELSWTAANANPLTVTILASNVWCPTGIILEAGKSYELKAAGSWFDLEDSTGPEGRTSWAAHWRQFRWWSPTTWFVSPRAISCWAKRSTHAPWMTLIGMVNHATDWQRKTLPFFPYFLLYFIFIDPKALVERQFPIGQKRVYKPKKTGPLYCFANDMWPMYRNNAGSISLTVVETDASDSGDELRDRLVSVVVVLTSVLIGLIAIKLAIYGLPKVWDFIQFLIHWISTLTWEGFTQALREGWDAIRRAGRWLLAKIVGF